MFPKSDDANLADGLRDPNVESDGESDSPVDELELAYLQALRTVEAVESRQTAVFDETAAGLPQDDKRTSASPATTDATETADKNQTPGLAAERLRVAPQQIIEAALFVGGMPLTTKRLCSLLNGEFDFDFVESTIETLNHQYTPECRPYEIVFGEGGYRFALRSEFEQIRNRAYGMGPKEVKLSQEALEVLSLVAYRQPISRGQLERAGKENPGSTLRQLVRRELIAIERNAGSPQEVNYRTTPRFLQVFGLKDIEELPQSDDDFSFK